MKLKKWKITPAVFTNFILLSFIIGVIFSPFAGSCRDAKDIVFAQEENPLLKSKAIASAVDIQQALREIYKQASPSVVRIETEQTVRMRNNADPFFFGIPQQGNRHGLGSGFIISKDGYIVTNNHVVEKVDKITVKVHGGKSYNAKIIGSDEISDLALIKIDGENNLKPVFLGDSDSIRVGDFGIAIGNPFGLESTFTFGVISSTGQDIETPDGISRIQTDAAINPGNSGGPLLNIKGEVIGINQMIYSQSGGSVGIGFAIPINHVKVVVENLKKGKKIKPGYIGVSVVDPSEMGIDRMMNELGIKDKKGLLVRDVTFNSPAMKAGLRQYDFIIEVDGVAADKFSVLKSAVMRKGSGGEIDVKYIRAGKTESVKVKIEEMPSREQQ
ncbi:MAG: trypsin-like peptidase domain-containing protein [Spirochaetia bacterium]|nr:trypsin-like peptidase domain-containing protein [Spirochaetia bacterium]